MFLSKEDKIFKENGCESKAEFVENSCRARSID